MKDSTFQRLFGYDQAFEHPVTFIITASLAVALAVTPVLLSASIHFGKINGNMRRELWLRYATWLILVPLIVGPILLGAFWTTIAVTALSLGCYIEFSRRTQLVGEWSINATVILGILAVGFGALDHWWELFSAAIPLTICVTAVIAVLQDRPEGYLQRVALAAWAFVLFGAALGHLSYLANDPGYRPVLLLILLGVEINDIFAFVCGKLFGRRKLAPQTSPGKTIGGSAGALALTSLLIAAIGQFVFDSPPLHSWAHLLTIGLMISLLGQLGDLMLSSVKRDVGIKDMGTLLPGHGGLLDRFDSLILVAPATFYYIGYFQGVAQEEPLRIFSTGQ